MRVIFVIEKGFVISQNENVCDNSIATDHYTEIKLQNPYEFTHTFRPIAGVH